MPLSNNKVMKDKDKIKIAKDLTSYFTDESHTKIQFYKDCGLSEFTIGKMLKNDTDQEICDDAWRAVKHFLKTGKKYKGFPIERKEQISKQMIEYLNSRDDISQNKLAGSIGVSAAVISFAMNSEKFSQDKLISNDMWRKIESYFDVPNTDHWALFATTNYINIMSLCEDAQNFSRFLACIGDTGWGKTAALKEYARVTPNAYYVLCEVVMSQKEFLLAIMKSIGVNISGSSSTIINGITERLIQTENPLLILDDAGKLSDSNLAMIQLLYDKTDGHTRKAGLIIAGMPHLKLHIEKGVQLGKRGFAELHRRIGYWLSLVIPSRPIIQELCKHHGINDKDVQRYIYKIATNYGTLKELITNIKRISTDGVTMDDLEKINVGDVDCYI